jgi:hypothetical protein
LTLGGEDGFSLDMWARRGDFGGAVGKGSNGARAGLIFNVSPKGLLTKLSGRELRLAA